MPELLALFPDVLLVIDQAGMITHLNREAEELFGAQATELLSRPLEILIPARFRAQHMRAPHTRPMGAHLDLSAWRPDI